MSMSGVPCGDSLGGLRTQRQFITVREYSAESLRGKDTSGDLEDSGHRLPKSPHGIAQDTHELCNMCFGPQAREAHWRLGVWGFCGGWSHRHKAPERKLVTVIEAIAGTNNPDKLMQRVLGPLVHRTT